MDDRAVYRKRKRVGDPHIFELVEKLRLRRRFAHRSRGVLRRDALDVYFREVRVVRARKDFVAVGVYALTQNRAHCKGDVAEDVPAAFGGRLREDCLDVVGAYRQLGRVLDFRRKRIVEVGGIFLGGFVLGAQVLENRDECLYRILHVCDGLGIYLIEGRDSLRALVAFCLRLDFADIRKFEWRDQMHLRDFVRKHLRDNRRFVRKAYEIDRERHRENRPDCRCELALFPPICRLVRLFELALGALGSVFFYTIEHLEFPCGLTRTH